VGVGMVSHSWLSCVDMVGRTTTHGNICAAELVPSCITRQEHAKDVSRTTHGNICGAALDPSCITRQVHAKDDS